MELNGPLFNELKLARLVNFYDGERRYVLTTKSIDFIIY